MKRLIVILGPTASGKSKLAVQIALRLSSGQAKKKFGINGAEIVSADSRQVYRGMNIGTGKITQKERQGIPHHLLDVISPKEIFTVALYRKLALEAINKIRKRRKLPILCGGTGFYIQAVVDGQVFPEIPPDWKLRKKLEKKSALELYNILKKLDPRRAKTIEKKNPRRLIRAIEIVKKTKKAVPLPRFRRRQGYSVLMVGLKLSKKQLRERIKKRVKRMLRLGLEKEAKKFPKEIIGYQEWKDYFEKKIKKKKVKDLIEMHTLQYAKRQMTWFKRDKRIHWVKNYKEAERLTKKWITCSQ